LTLSAGENQGHEKWERDYCFHDSSRVVGTSHGRLLRIAIEGTGRSSARAREELKLSHALLGEGLDALDHGCPTHNILLGRGASVGDQSHRCWTVLGSNTVAETRFRILREGVSPTSLVQRRAETFWNVEHS
jgi:hypothetical protein